MGLAVGDGRVVVVHDREGALVDAGNRVEFSELLDVEIRHADSPSQARLSRLVESSPGPGDAAEETVRDVD